MHTHRCPECQSLFHVRRPDPLWRLAAMAPGLIVGHKLKGWQGAVVGAGLTYLAHEALAEVSANCPECKVALEFISAVAA